MEPPMRLGDGNRMDYCERGEYHCTFPECSCALTHEPEIVIKTRISEPANVVPLHETVQKTLEDNTAYGCCPNCKSNLSPVFMVKDELWRQSGMEGWPCILCFEKAIGRRLKLEDLKPTPLCNHMLPCGWFLGDRPFGKQA